VFIITKNVIINLAEFDKKLKRIKNKSIIFLVDVRKYFMEIIIIFYKVYKLK